MQQGGVRLDGQRVSDINAKIAPPIAGDSTGAGSGAMILRVGRRRFLRLMRLSRTKSSPQAESDIEENKVDNIEESGPY